MKRPTLRLISAAGFAVATAFAAATSASDAQASDVTEYVVEAEYDIVRQDLGDAVINRGYKIDYNAFVGDMLARTSQDVGGKKELYEKAELIQFCSAVLSRNAMEADPANIAFCPYVLFVYERADEKGKVRVGFRRLDEVGSDASKQALAAINAVLDEIVQEAADQ